MKITITNKNIKRICEDAKRTLDKVDLRKGKVGQISEIEIGGKKYKLNFTNKMPKLK
jgi:hypothetical protein